MSDDQTGSQDAFDDPKKVAERVAVRRGLAREVARRARERSAAVWSSAGRLIGGVIRGFLGR